MEASKEIKIIPQLINEPDLSKRFYPGITYQIDPKLPIISGKTTYAELKDKDGKVLARSPNGGVFSWIPAISDTGKVMYLERYISGNLFGQKYPIKISNFQNPEIYRMVESGNNVIRIFTNSYGLVNKSPNYINFIEIIEGNIKVREIIGAQQAPDKENLLYKQVFEITPIDPSKIFKFKIRAISENGLKSDIRVYSKD